MGGENLSSVTVRTAIANAIGHPKPPLRMVPLPSEHNRVTVS